MSYLFGDLKETLKYECFPDGVPENLWELPNGNPGPIQKLFVEAMMAIQYAVPSLQRNNTQIVNFCSTFFQCGLTVLEAPRGRILNLRTVPKLNSECVGDDDSPLEWCAEVKYDRVDYNELTKVLDRTMRARCSCGFGWLANVPQFQCRKTLSSAFPPPDDSGYCNYPELPMGFHYPQDSTDLTWRAKAGVWALYRNRIYVAPWINSFETIVMDWDGQKRDWSDNDAVDTTYNPRIEKAVRMYVMMNYFGGLRRDPTMYAYYSAEYYGNLLAGGNIIGALPELIADERDNTRALAEKEQESHARMSGQTLQGQSTGTICLTDPECLPTAPSALNGSEDAGIFTLNWTRGNGIQDQEIWVSVNGDPYTLAVSVSSLVATHNFSWSYDPGDNICYKVRGKSPCGYSSYSTELCVIVVG